MGLDSAQAGTHQQQGKRSLQQHGKQRWTLPFDFGASQFAVPPVVCQAVVPLGANWIGGVASIAISSFLRVWTLATDFWLKLVKYTSCRKVAPCSLSRAPRACGRVRTNSSAESVPSSGQADTAASVCRRPSAKSLGDFCLFIRQQDLKSSASHSNDHG